MKNKLDIFDKTDDHLVKYNYYLKERLQEHTENDRIDISVRTIGKRSEITSNGTYERQIKGWTLTDDEIDTLSTYGTFDFIPDFISTTASLSHVLVGDLAEIANLPFVIELNYEPEIKEESFDKNDIRGDSFLRFAEANYNIGSNIRIGLIDRGYEGGGHGAYTSSHADDIGIDNFASKDFSDDDNWTAVISDHGDNMANTTAWCIGQGNGHDDLFVILKTRGFNNTGTHASRIRSAIEYAEQEDIEIINMSLGTDGPYDYCPSIFCDELSSYTDAGYLAFASTGNDSETDKATFPGGGWYTIGAGVADSMCGTSDYDRRSSSNYGDIEFYHIQYGIPYCSFCYNAAGTQEFTPDVYGLSVDTASDSITGTSVASAQAAAAGAIMIDNNVSGYNSAKATFRDMENYEICPNWAALEGELLDAEYADQNT